MSEGAINAVWEPKDPSFKTGKAFRRLCDKRNFSKEIKRPGKKGTGQMRRDGFGKGRNFIRGTYFTSQPKRKGRDGGGKKRVQLRETQ